MIQLLLTTKHQITKEELTKAIQHELESLDLNSLHI